jgi:hypothetical protein
VAWSPRLPDFTPMNFFLLGHIKALIHTSTVDSEEDHRGSSLAFLRAHPSLCCIIVGCELRVVAVGLNICSKFV